jgi:hypothetical protein
MVLAVAAILIQEINKRKKNLDKVPDGSAEHILRMRLGTTDSNAFVYSLSVMAKFVYGFVLGMVTTNTMCNCLDKERRELICDALKAYAEFQDMIEKTHLAVVTYRLTDRKDWLFYHRFLNMPYTDPVKCY